MSKIVVTGASGFVGRHLCEHLQSIGHDVTGTSRSISGCTRVREINKVATGEIGGDFDWRPVLREVDCVVHLAARVHVMRETDRDPLSEFRKVNVDGTRSLIRDCGALGVKRFIYLSTAKVCGEESRSKSFSACGYPLPEDPYALSKHEAEQVVETTGTKFGMETVILRPPLVYGPGVGGNFLRLLRLVRKGFPLPFASVDNLRSLVGVNNLCDLISECLHNTSAAGKIFMVSDNRDLSTPELIRIMAASMSRSARLVPVPTAILALMAKLTGQSAPMSRLIGSLQVNVDETMKTLNWSPPVSTVDGIQAMVTWYLEQGSDE